mmetsp:Transcript_3936/g.8865  ORF Transcript_3936/g.8865 Transcript_3936/m.8865 type:complete len:185 (+) Transcript_3936:18-572(+)
MANMLCGARGHSAPTMPTTMPSASLRRRRLGSPSRISKKAHTESSRRSASSSASCEEGPLSALPGDPSIILNTNVTIPPGEKRALAKALSAAVASCLGKPESYVAVCINDGNADGMIFGGSDEPCALACVYSLGAINKTNNEKLSAEVARLLQETCDVAPNRYYVNFFDVPRENCGYNGKTFAS